MKVEFSLKDSCNEAPEGLKMLFLLNIYVAKDSTSKHIARVDHLAEPRRTSVVVAIFLSAAACQLRFSLNISLPSNSKRADQTHKWKNTSFIFAAIFGHIASEKNNNLATKLNLKKKIIISHLTNLKEKQKSLLFLIWPKFEKKKDYY